MNIVFILSCTFGEKFFNQIGRKRINIIRWYVSRSTSKFVIQELIALVYCRSLLPWCVLGAYCPCVLQELIALVCCSSLWPWCVAGAYGPGVLQELIPRCVAGA